MISDHGSTPSEAGAGVNGSTPSEAGAGVHGSTPSEAGAGVFILADTPKIAKFKTGVENYGSVSMGRYQGSVSRGLPPMGHS